MKKRLLFFSAAFLIGLGVLAQTAAEQHQLILQSYTLVSSGNEVPFWLQMNRLGVVDGDDSFQQLFLLNWDRKPAEGASHAIQLTCGMNVLGRLSDHSEFRFNEYWGRLHFKNYYLHAGAKAEPVFANGLSLTNGNLFLSNNARPMPRVEFGIQKFHFFDKGWLSRFSFDLQYAEFFLLDDRFVDNAHLHHKKFGITCSLAPQWTVSAGIDHWVFWGGNSPVLGEMPGFEDYFRYIFGKAGSIGAPSTDQDNVAGNQLGQYLADVVHTNDHFKLKLYWQHLWEDHSGMEFDNMPDGLWGIYWQQKSKRKLLEAMLLEYVNTRDQSGAYHLSLPHPDDPGRLTGRGRDNYFNHGVYRSGFVSYGRMMGVPLFVPEVDGHGISHGFEDTRLWAIHYGMNGWLTDYLGWKTLLSFSRNYGTYDKRYPSPKRFLSLAAQLNYSFRQKPVRCSVKLAYDKGAVLDSAFGAEFSLLFKLH